ncbi:MAG: tRNA (guanosine(37)-N1)-methyltransferase TrmD [Bacteroidia bacterium]|jgi:tRNA (guanine37-N1)-methyltransferase
MHIDIITLFPDMVQNYFEHSIMKRAQAKQLATINVINLRDYSTNKHKKVDDYPFGGGAGMVMSIEPIAACINALKAQRTYDEIIFLTPDGEVFNQPTANRFSSYENIILLCGHYKGIDERARELFVTKELSIGDYVLTGGELAACVVADAIIRVMPGVLNDETSALSDSFQDNLLSPPVYTRPANYMGHQIPEVLLSGHPIKIADWRHEQALQRTQARRPDLLK